MVRKVCGWCLLALFVSIIGWTDEPVPARQPVKQRVSPKLLREAMALPEYQGQPPEPAPLNVDDLQQLSDKLRKNSDSDGADLLDRFIREYRLIAAHSVHSQSGIGKLILHVKVFEAKPDDIQKESVFHGKVIASPLEVQQELEKLIAAGKAKLAFDPILIESKANVPIRSFSDGEFPIALHDGKKASLTIRDFGLNVHLLPTICGKQKIRLKVTSDNEPTSGVPTLKLTGTGSAKASGDVYEMNLDEALIHSAARKDDGNQVFVIIEATPRN